MILVVLTSLVLTFASAGPTPITPEMAYVPAGDFVLGEKWGEGGEESEAYGSTVYVDAFYLDPFEVTNANYRAYLNGVGKGRPKPAFWSYSDLNQPDQPVVGIAQAEALDYCSAQGKRLPTEFEWEKAARGGRYIKYPWGNEAPESIGLRAKPFVPHFPARVGSLPRNRSLYGAYDMVGNVWEWTSTNFDYYFYRQLTGRSPQLHNPKGPPTGLEKTVRGGSWANSSWVIRTTTRFFQNPATRSATTGFRCARDAKAAR